jgi:long-chain acyl-CoA synthetase
VTLSLIQGEIKVNIANILVASAYAFPNNIALIDGKREITYRELDQESNKIASGLVKIGVRPGDRICICAPNSYKWVAFYFGLLKSGAVIVSTNINFSVQELLPIMEQVKPKVLFTVEEKLPHFNDICKEDYLKVIISDGTDITYSKLIQSGAKQFKIVDRDRDDVASIPFTGGTTGIPKGILLTHQNLECTGFNMGYHDRTTERDREICFLPIDHTFAQHHVLLGSLIFGAGVIIHSSFDLDLFLRDLVEKKVTKLIGLPTIYVRLLQVKNLREKLKSIRYCFSAGAGMPSGIRSKWKELTGHIITDSYGLTESGQLTFNHLHRHVLGSVGTVVHNMEVQIRDKKGNLLKNGEKGEICARGPSIMKCYLNNPDLTAASFWERNWLRTGDIGYLDENGYLYISGRIKEMIITGGENVYPAEVENVLSTRKEVKECAVVGVPDEEYGEKIVAFIIPVEGSKIDASELKRFLKSRLAGFKVPKEFLPVADFPKSRANKILRHEIAKHYIENKQTKYVKPLGQSTK